MGGCCVAGGVDTEDGVGTGGWFWGTPVPPGVGWVEEGWIWVAGGREGEERDVWDSLGRQADGPGLGRWGREDCGEASVCLLVPLAGAAEDGWEEGGEVATGAEGAGAEELALADCWGWRGVDVEGCWGGCWGGCCWSLLPWRTLLYDWPLVVLKLDAGREGAGRERA
jgi:hypothetical protein